MLSTTMTREEREAFLAEARVAMLAVAREGAPPLLAPLWFTFDAHAGEVVVIIDASSRKARLLVPGTSVSLAVQDERPPYAYVTVEGRVAAIRPADDDEHFELAKRYLGEQLARAYMDRPDRDPDALAVTIRPQRWRTFDYTKRLRG